MKNKRTDAFTLIEVLASMIVLLLLVTALMRLFASATDIFDKTTQAVIRNGTASAALEQLKRDIEGSIIDNRLAMTKQSPAGALGGLGFDNLDLITINSDVKAEKDKRVYQQVRYYVTNETIKVSGATVDVFRLMRSTRDFEEYNSFEPGKKEWWKSSTNFKSVPLLNNIVRFDVWLCDEENMNLQDIAKGYNSNAEMERHAINGGKVGKYEANRPPAYVDIYIQVTSEKAMIRAAMLYKGGNTADAQKLLYQESNILTTRIRPPQWAAERHYPYRF